MQIMYLSTKPGDPSTLWVSDSGKVYRTKKEAENDRGNEIDPNHYEIVKPWYKHYKQQIQNLIAAVIGAAVVYFLIKKQAS